MEKINFYFPTTWLQNVDYRFRLCWCYHQQNPFKRESEGDESIKINANGSTAPENFISNQDLEVANGCMPGATLAHNPQMADKLNDLKKLTDKVTDGGNLIFSSCITGVGEPGKLFGENLWQFTGERLNIFNAKDFINPGWLQDNVDHSKAVWFSRNFNASWLETTTKDQQVNVKSVTLSAVVGTPPVTIK